MEEIAIWKLVLVFIVIVALILLGTLPMFFSAQKFFELANELEEDIKKEDNYEHHLIELMKLSEKSFHRNTGNRVRELAKMMEVKYNVELLKR